MLQSNLNRRGHKRRNYRHHHHQLSEPLVPPSSSSHVARSGINKRYSLSSSRRWTALDAPPEIELIGNYRPPSTMIPLASDGQYATPSTSTGKPTSTNRVTTYNSSRQRVLPPPTVQLRDSHLPQPYQQPFQDLSLSLFSHGCCCVQCVRTQELGIAENFGAFDEIVGPGLYLAIWPCSTIKSRLSLRIQQVDVTCETKSLDNVFLNITVSILYRVIPERAYEANYGLTNVERQLQTYVYSIVRGKVPEMTIDELFESTSDVSESVFLSLVQELKEYGYHVVETLVTRISPNEKVRRAMNDINASKRLKDAVHHQAEAEKLTKVKQAEASAETLHLHGTGIANQRRAIIEGMKETVNGSTSIQSKDIMSLLLLSQYMDTLVAVGANSLIVRPKHDAVLNIQQHKMPRHREANQFTPRQLVTACLQICCGSYTTGRT